MSQIIVAHKIIGAHEVHDIFGGIAVWKGEQAPPSHVAMFDREERQMNKKISYLELLKMVKSGKQPEDVYYLGTKFHYERGRYSAPCGTTILSLGQMITCSFTEHGIVDAEPIIYECEVLDEAEKKYLRAVIAPFRKRVRYIKKLRGFSGKEYIQMYIAQKGAGENRLFFDISALPNFEAGTMYKGMEVGKEYTIEDLNL